MKRNRSATTSSFNGYVLPKWAKLIPPRNRNDPRNVGSILKGKKQEIFIQSPNLCDPNDTLEKQKEDDYLRTLTYHSIAQFLESHLQKLLETSCSAIVCELLESRAAAPSIDIDVINDHVSNEKTAPSLYENKSTECVITDRIRTRERISHGVSTATPDPASGVHSRKDLVATNCAVPTNSAYDPLFLPVYLLDNGPFSMIDKLLITSHLFHKVQKAEPRTCCVALPSVFNGCNGYQKYNVSFKDDFMNQCWNQEINRLLSQTNDVPRRKRIYRQLKKIRSTLSVTDQLVLWSSQTIYFDSIAVFWNIEHGSVIYSHHSNILNSGKQSFERFIQWCAERRVIHGIPISIIMHNPKNGYRQAVPFYSSIQSMIGIRLYSITAAPDTTTMFDQFWRNIISDITHHNHPTALFVYSLCQSYTMDVFKRLCTFQDQDQSISRFIDSTKELIAKYLSTPSSWKSFPSAVAVLLHRPIRSTNLLKRITSLLYDCGFSTYLRSANPESSSVSPLESGSRLFFREIEEYELRFVLVSIILQVYDKIWGKYIQGANRHHTQSTSLKSLSVFSFLLFDIENSDLKNGCKFDNVLLNEEDRQFLVNVVFEYRTKSRTSSAVNHGPISTVIDVFADRRNSAEGVQVERILRLVNEMIVMFDRCISLQDVLLCLKSALMGFIQIDTKVLHQVPSPRRDLVHALLEGNKIRHGTKSSALISIPGLLYEIIQDRISISEVEWYQTFLLRYKYEIDSEDSPTSVKIFFPLFACGIRHLQVAGLIRRSIGKNSTVHYERTGLVWCGGD